MDKAVEEALTLVPVTLTRQVEDANGSHRAESYTVNRRLVTLKTKKDVIFDTFFMSADKTPPRFITFDTRQFKLSQDELYVYYEQDA